MPANEFEKKVQQKMEELQLSPHAEVWRKWSAASGKKINARVDFIG